MRCHHLPGEAIGGVGSQRDTYMVRIGGATRAIGRCPVSPLVGSQPLERGPQLGRAAKCRAGDPGEDDQQQ